MLLIVNGQVVTRDPAQPLLLHGAVAIEGTRIMAVGEETALRAAYPQAELLDAEGGLVMPGLINAHQHIYSTPARGLALSGYAPQGFLDVLDGLWWRLDRGLTLDDCRVSARVSAIDCIKNGVTTVFDHHASYGAVSGSLFTLAEELRHIGLRSCLCFEVSDRRGTSWAELAACENADFIDYAREQGGEDLAALFGLHASFTLSDATLARCRELTPEGVGFHIHVAEGAEDAAHCREHYGCGVVERLHQQGILGPHTIAAHCIHISPTEIELLAATDTLVAHNPESNMGNAVGCPATLAQKQAGITVGLGTDGYTNDMLESLKAANLLHKHALRDCTAGGDIADLLFVNNAAIAARFFPVPLGRLAPGYGADVIVCDYQPPTPLSADNINGHVLFGLSGRAVTATVCQGRVLMYQRQLRELDEAAEAAHSREQLAELWQRLNS